MRRLASFCALLLAACAGAPAPRQVAGSIPPSRHVERPTVRLAVDDVLGRAVRLGAPQQQRVTVVFLMSKDARDESAALGRAVDEQLLDAPIDQISIVDLSELSSFVRPMARSSMRKAAATVRDTRRRRREEHHVDASDAAVDRWHLVGDFDGALLARFEIEPGLEKPLAFVVAPTGEYYGPYTDPSMVATRARRLLAASRRAARTVPASARSRSRIVSR